MATGKPKATQIQGSATITGHMQADGSTYPRIDNCLSHQNFLAKQKKPHKRHHRHPQSPQTTANAWRWLW